MRITLLLFVFTFLLPADTVSREPTFRSDVDMVTLSFRVEHKNRFVTGLTPADIRILENGRVQRIENFSHPQSRIAIGADQPESVFLLLDTSNPMYSGFAYARDAIAGFIRSLDPKHSIAVYTFSRNVARASGLTTDRLVSLASLIPLAGDDTALYNAMLLVLRDAAKVPGPKKLVVSSNGGDNASQISPDDVSRVAEDLGVPIYVLSTNGTDTMSQAVWNRITTSTGGSVHVASNWGDQRTAFEDISTHIRNTYTVTYYSNNVAPGYRRIEVIVQDRKYFVACRPGYYAPK